jgi:hypothetical protein
MTAYALRDGEDTILVDPLVAGETEPLLAALDEIVRGRLRSAAAASAPPARPGAAVRACRNREHSRSCANVVVGRDYVVLDRHLLASDGL